jgi:carbonic anhydrase/acetyltransferase-like protein (isoleucine patch superfamily)
VLNGAVVGTGSLVAAGTVILEGTVIPPRSLVAGVPGKVRRTLSDEEYERVVQNAVIYVDLSARHRAIG